jgi:hypothetical protein
LVTETVKYPGAKLPIDGALHPAGIFIFSVPYPAGVAQAVGPFVYVKTIVLSQLPAVTCAGLTTTLPSPTHCVAVTVGVGVPDTELVEVCVGVFVGVAAITVRQAPHSPE